MLKWHGPEPIIVATLSEQIFDQSKQRKVQVYRYWYGNNNTLKVGCFLSDLHFRCLIEGWKLVSVCMYVHVGMIMHAYPSIS